MARARVEPAHEREYREAIATLAAHLGARGLQLWLFRSRHDPRQFLEFAEGPAGAPHRGESGHSAERTIEQRLRELATYDDGADAAWDGVPLNGENHHGSTGR